MRFFLVATLCLAGFIASPAMAEFSTPLDRIASGTSGTRVAVPREVIAYIDKSEQRMTVRVNGWERYSWPVSTARRGKITPNGDYTAYFLSRHHRSSLYDNAPMPFSIFFHGNYAIHSTDQVSRLGRPASAGCVRLHPDNASILFDLTKQVGLENMKVVIRD